jgi:hypothetical protein
MEVDKDALYYNIAINDPSHPQGIFEAVPMDGVLFYSEINDMDMVDTFATIRKLPQVALLHVFIWLIL